jgi:hypothetical protein
LELEARAKPSDVDASSRSFLSSLLILESLLHAVIARTRNPIATENHLNFILPPRPFLIAAAALLGCNAGDKVTNPDEISRGIRQQVVNAYNLKDTNFVANVMGLYPTTGKIVSASGGRVITSRDSLKAGIEVFWQDVGSRMRNPDWQWTSMQVDVLSPESAALTATYRVPHWTPQGTPHIIGGAWTAVFKREERGGRGDAGNTKWVIIQEHLSDQP